MIRALVRNLKTCWKSLVVADLVFKGVAFIALTPVVSLLFRGFLSLANRELLADADIARFLIHPLGWIAAVVVGAAMIGILALEQAALMAICLSAEHGRPLDVLSSLRFAAGRVGGIYRLAASMVGLLLLVAAPFLIAGIALYGFLLTDHDINYYLTKQPPKFWFAVGAIGTLLVSMAVVLLQRIVNWSVAMQLYLFEGIPLHACLKLSRDRVRGHRPRIAKWVIGWLTANALVSWIGTVSVVALGRWVVPASAGALSTLVVTLGVMLLLWGLVNLASSLLSAISFAALQAQVYDRIGRTSAVLPSAASTDATGWSVTWTRGRLLSVLAIGVTGVSLVGATVIRSMQLEDNVEITAHRGASGKAPENTLAAVRQAIDDGADWVEIDVQESKDGVVIVAHDSDLMKVARFGGKIWETTAEELRAIDIGSYFGPTFSAERVPTLAEVLQTCRGRVGVNIELKYYGHDQDLEQKVVDLVEEYGMADEIVVMSLSQNGVRKMKALRPDWRVGLLTAVAAGDLTRTDADFLAVSSRLATREFVRRAHERGKMVSAWTVNDPAAMSVMISRGVDNLITDHPALARQVVQERAAMSPVERLLVELANYFGVRVSADPQTEEP